MHSFELKKLAARNLEAALDKAEVYRALNEPGEAESICRDILAVDEKNAKALRLLGLSLTDQFPNFRVGLFEEAMSAFEKLTDAYERIYHQGIAWERLGKAHLARNEGHGALTSIEHALEAYEGAEAIGPKDLPDPILRWNRCVRLLQTHPLLKDAIESPRSQGHILGD